MTRHLHIAAILLVAQATLLPLAAFAETVTETADLPANHHTASYIFSQPSMTLLGKLAATQDKQLGLAQQCTSGYQVKPLTMAVLTPIEYPDDAAHPTAGIWLVRYEAERCGQTKIYNASFVAHPDGKAPTVAAYFPGSTYASPVLVKDAMMAAVPSALIRSGQTGCKDIKVMDMQPTAIPRDVAEGSGILEGVWKETWTFLICGRQVAVPMTFTPDADGHGTTFSTGPAALMQDGAAH